MRRSIAALVSALALTLTGCAHAEDGEDPAVDPVLARVGAGDYQQYCAACHGLAGEGDGPAGGALRTRPPDLTRIAERRGGAFPEAEIARFVDGRFEVAAHGTREMPIWGLRFGAAIPEPAVSDEIVRGRIQSLVEFLKSIQRDGS